MRGSSCCACGLLRSLGCNLFVARATENADGSLNPKSLKNPYIVRLADGSFEIHAVRIEGDGQAEEKETELCFKSYDLVVYEEVPECAW